MQLPSISARLYQLVGLMCLLVLLAVSMLALKQVDYHVHARMREVLRLDKALSELDSYEESALRGAPRDPATGHSRMAGLFKDQLTPDVEKLLAARRKAFEELLGLSLRIENEHMAVFSQLLDITKAVRYIHRHHVAYLQNLVNREALAPAPHQTEHSRTDPNESAGTELSIVQEALDIYTSLFDIHAAFFKLHQPDQKDVAEFFALHMSKFNAAINRFEDYSADAQDGLLIEELILVGKQFETSFSGLLKMEQERVRLAGLLEQTRKSLDESTQAYLARQEANVKHTRMWSDALQYVFIAAILLMAILLISRCSQLSKAVKQISSETSMLQSDLSHRVDVDSARFDEFHAVFSTFNKMAGTLSRQMRQLTDMAFSDTLTGLPNRALLARRLEQAINRSRVDPDYIYAVIFLDLDRFKVINDSLGHKFGDEVLRIFSKALSECVRDGDTVARLGGDEFAILLDNPPSRREVIRIVRRIRERIARRVSVAGFGLIIQASIGISITPTGKTPEDILRAADIAMYDAKKKGVGKFKVYTPSLGEQALRTLNMEIELRQAIENREIEVHFQPIVELTTGRIHGLEALARWNHPEHGPIAPSTFIPLAEECGLIMPLGRLVLCRACKHASEWNREAGPEEAMTLHVNLSPRQFCDAGLVQEVSRVLDECGMPPHLLNLEITETMLMTNALVAMNILNRLKDLGVKLSLDDFGTGYSSLGNLRNFPVDMFKIDRSFIKRLEGDKKTRNMVQLILALSRTLDKEVVAEGVEKPSQVEMLNDLGCRFVQGYYYSRPLDVRGMDALLRTGSTGPHGNASAPAGLLAATMA